MILFMEGFDQLRDVSSAGSPSQLLTYLNASGYTSTTGVSIDEGRTQAVKALKLSDTASINRKFISTANKVVIGFAYLAASKRSDIITIPTLGAMTWDASTGKVTLAGGTGTATILLGLWYYFEIVVDKANQLVQVYVNNGKDIEAQLPAAAVTSSTYDCTWRGVAGDSKKLDDILVLDSSGGKYLDRVGPVALQARIPTADADKEWSPSTGSDHWDLVNNQPPKDDEYVQSNTSGAMDTYLSNQGLPQGASIVAVSVTVLNKKSDIDARQLGVIVGRKGSPQKQVLDTELTVTPKYTYAVFESAPGDAAWTDESVTSIPFGVAVRP